MPPFPPGSRLCAYLRDSGGDRQELSIDQQREALTTWAQDAGCVITRIFSDPARSGKSTAARHAFLEMLDYLAGGAPEAGVLLWEYARLSRDFDDAQYHLADLRRQGYGVYSVQDRIPDDLDGRLMESILSWKNAKALHDLSRAVKRGLSYVIRIHHAYIPPVPPVGYRRVQVSIGLRRDGTQHMISVLELDPGSAPRVRLAFDMRANRRTFAEIHAATGLYDHKTSYLRMVHNPLYTGRLVKGGQVVEGYCPAIVPDDVWQACQYQQGLPPRADASPYLLTGLLRCLTCGRQMGGLFTVSRGKRWYYYRHNNSGRWDGPECDARMIPVEPLDAAVIDVLRQRLTTPDLLRQAYAEVVAQAEQAAELHAQAAQEAGAKRKRLQAEITNLVDALRQAGPSPALISALNSAEIALAHTPELRQIPVVAVMSWEVFQQRAHDTAAKLDEQPFRERQLLLRGMVESVKARRGRGGLEVDVTVYDYTF